MSTIDTNPELSFLKVELGYMDPPEEVRAAMLRDLEAAEAYLVRKRIIIDHDAPDDVQLLVAYAAYLYRHRDDPAEMPQSLSYALRNRRVSAATEGKR